jgi:hypothetical protein
MTSARKTASLICAAAALAAGVGAVAARRGQTSAANAAALRSQHEAAGMLETTQKALEGLKRGLEIEAQAAAALPQLKTALGEGVDAVTIIDLFDSEDWWAPFRARSAALVTAGRTLAARVDKGGMRMPLPGAAMLERAHTAGVASGVLIGDSAVIVALVPVAAAPGDSIYLVLAMPLAAQDLQKATVCRSCYPTARGRFRWRAAPASSPRCRVWSAGRGRGARAIGSRPGWLSRPRWVPGCGCGCCTRRRPGPAPTAFR